MYNFSKSLAALAGLLVVSMFLIGLAVSENSAVKSQAKTQVEGVWKIAEVLVPPKTPAEKATTITNPRASLIILTKGYYSFLAEREKRPDFAPAAIARRRRCDLLRAGRGRSDTRSCARRRPAHALAPRWATAAGDGALPAPCMTRFPI